MYKSVGNHIASRYALWLQIAAVMALLVLSYWLQTYRFTELEEWHIMVFDIDHVGSVLVRPGGASQLLASLCTQFFLFRWVGPLVTALIYAVIIFSLASVGRRRRAPLWVIALSFMPCLCLFLCLENNSFLYKGVIAVMLNSLAICAYCRDCKGGAFVLIDGCFLSLIMYFLSGPVALAFALSAALYDIITRRQWLSLLYPLLALGFGYVCYLSGLLYTPEQVYAPVSCYEMGSTFFMMVYAMASVVLYVVVAAFSHGSAMSVPRWRLVALPVIVLVVEGAALWRVYSLVHSASNYRVQHERYLARHGQWADIAAMPYDGSVTPFTSYRFLALAHLGTLADRIGDYRPAISYLLDNKPQVRKYDQQVYSDVFYDCFYLAAARHSAFDTDIVTLGAFNPYETQKLVMINLAYGDYGVAEKLISRLENTLFYADWASDKRRFLYDDAAVMADGTLGRMRRAIPADNDYLSPKHIGRDLRDIAASDSSLTVAEQFHRAFVILVSQLSRPL